MVFITIIWTASGTGARLGGRNRGKGLGTGERTGAGDKCRNRGRAGVGTGDKG